jgi:hypothetical protein
MRVSVVVAVAIMVGAPSAAHRYAAREPALSEPRIALPPAPIAWPPINPNNFSLTPQIDAQEIRRFHAEDMAWQIADSTWRTQDFQVFTKNPAGRHGMVPQ